MDEATFRVAAPKNGVFNDFIAKQELAINVYQMLMSSELIAALKKAKLTDNQIHTCIDFGEIDYINAHEASLSSKRQLKKTLDLFIAEIAGVKDM